MWLPWSVSRCRPGWGSPLAVGGPPDPRIGAGVVFVVGRPPDSTIGAGAGLWFVVGCPWTPAIGAGGRFCSLRGDDPRAPGCQVSPGGAVWIADGDRFNPIGWRFRVLADLRSASPGPQTSRGLRPQRISGGYPIYGPALRNGWRPGGRRS